MVQTPFTELVRVRSELDSLAFSRLTDSTPSLVAHHEELCQREVVLLGRRELARSGGICVAPVT